MVLKFLRIALLTLLFSNAYFGCAARKFSGESKSNSLNSQTSKFDKSQMLFGAELEFTKKDLAPNEKYSPNSDVLLYFKNVKEACLKDSSVVCRFEGSEVPDLAFSVAKKGTTQKFRAHPSLDPQVVEIALDPLTLAELENVKDLIQKYVYEIAEQTNLVAGTNEFNRWSAHANFSWPGFTSGQDVELFLRYFVDLENHGAIALGAMGGDIRNAMPLAYFSKQVHLNLRAAIESFYRKEFANITDVTNYIRENVYLESGIFPGKRYHLLNIENARKENFEDANKFQQSSKRIEQRCVYMPSSAEAMISNFKIIAGRMDYLSKQTERIFYQAFPVVDKNFLPIGVQGGATAKIVAEVFYRYLSQANLDLKYHAKFIANDLVRAEFEKLLL